METTHIDPDLGSWRAWHRDDDGLRLGVSSCLLGASVRHDGGHKRDRFLTDTLGRWVEWVAVCPEVEVGMGVPRPAIRLVDGEQGLRLLAPETGEDMTERMTMYSKRRVGELEDQRLDGYILKKSSPSCGMARVRVYGGGRGGPGHRSLGGPRRDGVGVFARTLLLRWPNLPVEEEGRLEDAKLRENFVERLFCRNRWRILVEGGLSRQRLVRFHTAHQLLLLAHDPQRYRALGQLVAGAQKGGLGELYERYEAGFQETLKRVATPRKHANALQHAMGYLKGSLDPAEKRELLAAVEDFRLGLLPLIVPLTLLRFNINRHGVDYLKGQLYFDPHPKELMLRNHV